jgi:hypothetical protein
MKPFFYTRVPLLIIASLLLSGCYYDVEEELYPNQVCMTQGMSYQIDVAPLMALHCNGCHSTTSAPIQGAGIILDTYEGIKGQVDFGRLLGSIRRDPGFSPMPQGQPQIPSCSIDKIAAWIEDGAPNN